MESQKPAPGCGQVALLWFVVLPIMYGSCTWVFSKRDAQHKANAEAAKVAAEQSVDPFAAAAFNAGYEFGARYKATGLAKPTERELDEFVLELLKSETVPNEKRGIFISKFKRGFSWGAW